jgi:hypothetical protein
LSKTEHDIKFRPSTLENIDSAFYKHVEELGIGVTTNEGWKVVPVIWQGAEKAFQIKNDREVRDDNGMLIMPQITVLRTSTNKKLDKKGIFLNNSAVQDKTQGGEITISRKINQDKTAAYANSNAIKKTKGKLNFKTAARENERVVYSFLSIKTPVYLDINYDIVIRTEYQMHMNDIMSVLYTDAGSLNYFLIENDGHRYECFYGQDFAHESNVSDFDEDERIFKTVIPVNTLGYIIGSDKNDDQPTLTIKENRVDIKIKETIINSGE